MNQSSKFEAQMKLRILLGLAVAPLLASLAAAVATTLIAGNNLNSIFIVWGYLYVFGGLLGTLIVGVPALLIFWNRIQHRLRNACIVGSFAALVPFPLLFVWLAVGGKATISPILFSLTVAAMSSVAGALGGAMFYAIALRPRKTSNGAA